MNHAARIGIVGGGQLGRMITMSAKKLGLYVVVTDPNPESPAGQVADLQILADYKDGKAIRKLAKMVDVVTFEIELANSSVLLDILKKGKQVHPNPDTLSIIRDKYLQKVFLKNNHIPTAEFDEVTDLKNIEEIGEKFSYPFLLKARTDAYDGRGNYLVKNKSDIKKGIEKLRGRKLYVEEFAPFVKEIAVMVARTPQGKMKTYPVVETIHKNNICDTVIVPAGISKKAEERANTLAKKVMNCLGGAGVFGIEMFLLKNDSILINEIAPRVHNSGHYTVEACVTSQFEQHIRAITGLPLGDTSLLSKFSVMKNILGAKDGDGMPDGLEKALKIPGVSVHIYGKKDSRPGRKMGHVTVIGDSLPECIKKVERARKLLII